MVPMYTETNFKTKKALKEAIASGTPVRVFQPNDMFGKTEQVQRTAVMTVYLEGPHYPKPHTWYAEAIVSYGIIQKLK